MLNVVVERSRNKVKHLVFKYKIMNKIIEVENLSASFGEKEVLTDIDLHPGT